MTSKLVVNTIEADTGISSVSFASSISLSSSSVFHLGDAGINIGADTNISRAGNGVLGFNINGSEKVRITSSGRVGIGTNNPQAMLEVQDRSGGTLIGLSVGTQYGNASFGGYNNYPAIMNNTAQPLIYCDTNNDRTIFFGDTVGFGTTCAFRVNGAERARITSSGLSVTGVVSFSTGHTYKTLGYDPTLSPIQGDKNTWFYTRFDQSASVSGSTIVNLATGPIKISDTLPVSNMTRQSFGGSTAMYHVSATTGGTAVSTDFSAADPFAAKTHGLTMGALVYVVTATANGAGVMHYGANGNDEHFYIRFNYNYNSEDHGFSVGKDNDGSDAWHNVMKGSDVSGDTWYYIAARISQSGSIDFSLNGNPFYSVRIKGNTVRPGNARFGLAGDPYNDNASRHRYATAFWYRGLLSDQQIRDEYEWAKTIWTGASLP